jgi:hypothetical protein
VKGLNTPLIVAPGKRRVGQVLHYNCRPAEVQEANPPTMHKEPLHTPHPLLQCEPHGISEAKGFGRVPFLWDAWAGDTISSIGDARLQTLPCPLHSVHLLPRCGGRACLKTGQMTRSRAGRSAKTSHWVPDTHCNLADRQLQAGIQRPIQKPTTHPLA